MTVPDRHPNWLVRQVHRWYNEAPQADSAGSIPVTRSYHVRAGRHASAAAHPLPDCRRGRADWHGQELVSHSS